MLTVKPTITKDEPNRLLFDGQYLCSPNWLFDVVAADVRIPRRGATAKRFAERVEQCAPFVSMHGEYHDPTSPAWGTYSQRFGGMAKLVSDGLPKQTETMLLTSHLCMPWSRLAVILQSEENPENLLGLPVEQLHYLGDPTDDQFRFYSSLTAGYAMAPVRIFYHSRFIGIISPMCVRQGYLHEIMN